MKKQELIDAVNNGSFYSLWEIEDEGIQLPKCVASDLEPDEHRWYIITTSIYECEDGYVGIRVVTSLKSEMMSYSDTDEIAEAEAKKRIVAAQAEAEANRLRTQTLTPQVLEKAWIDKWDGVLPVYGQTPTLFKDITK